MFDKANKIITEFGERKLREAVSDGRSRGIKHRSNSDSPADSLANMKVGFGRRAMDLISVITYSLRRSLFFTYHGAGNGQGGKKGSTWQTKTGDRRKTATSSLGKAGTGNRTEKPFLDVITDGAEKMIDDVGEATMDEIFDKSFKRFK